MPLAMHINARVPEKRFETPPGLRQLDSVNGHKIDAMNALGHMIGSGVLERYPRLRVAVAEVGVGWIPFWLQEFDYYTARGSRSPLPRPPSEYFHRQVYATFISDGVGCHLLPDHGKDNFMWSNDCPHPACIWPDSGIVIAEDLGHLTPEDRARVTAGNVARLYKDGELPPAPEPSGDRTEVEVWLTTHTDFGAGSRLRNAPEAAS